MSDVPAPRTHPAAFAAAPPRGVLFLCVHNSARSQIAEGLARAVAPADCVVASAGTRPSRVHPLAIEVMGEIGIDISGQRSKNVADVPLGPMDTVVTLCAEGDAECPTVPAETRRVHWPLPDPSAAPEASSLAAFREVRDELKWRISSLWSRRD